MKIFAIQLHSCIVQAFFLRNKLVVNNTSYVLETVKPVCLLLKDQCLVFLNRPTGLIIFLQKRKYK